MSLLSKSVSCLKNTSSFSFFLPLFWSLESGKNLCQLFWEIVTSSSILDDKVISRKDKYFVVIFFVLFFIGHCKISEIVSRYFKRCSDFYSIDNGEDRDFEVGWKTKYENNSSQSTNITHSYSNHRPKRALRIRGDKEDGSDRHESGSQAKIQVHPKYKLSNGMIISNQLHWIYHTATDLRGFPNVGRFTIYSGGGYVAELGDNIEYATAAVAALKQDYWIDSYSRAVFFELTAFSMNTKFFATAFIIAEIIPTGQVVPKGEIIVFRLNRYDEASGKLILASEIICFLLLFFFVYREIRQISQIGLRSYFNGFWPWIETMQSLFLLSSVILWILRWSYEYQTMLLFKNLSYSFINFQYVAMADEAFNTAVAFMVFFSTLKLAKFLSFFPMIVILKSTLKKSIKPLFNYFLPFTIAFTAFLIFAYLVFQELYEFSTLIRGAESQFHMLIGGSIFKALRKMKGVLVPFYFVCFVVFETFILMNIFIAILCESIAESSSLEELTLEDLEFVEFSYTRLKDFICCCFPKVHDKSFKNLVDSELPEEDTLTEDDNQHPDIMSELPVEDRLPGINNRYSDITSELPDEDKLPETDYQYPGITPDLTAKKKLLDTEYQYPDFRVEMGEMISRIENIDKVDGNLHIKELQFIYNELTKRMKRVKDISIEHKRLTVLEDLLIQETPINVLNPSSYGKL